MKFDFRSVSRKLWLLLGVDGVIFSLGQRFFDHQKTNATKIVFHIPKSGARVDLTEYVDECVAWKAGRTSALWFLGGSSNVVP